MDIKTAFQNCIIQKRKRKAADVSTSEVEAKSFKLSDDTNNSELKVVNNENANITCQNNVTSEISHECVDEQKNLVENSKVTSDAVNKRQEELQSDISCLPSAVNSPSSKSSETATNNPDEVLVVQLSSDDDNSTSNSLSNANMSSDNLDTTAEMKQSDLEKSNLEDKSCNDKTSANETTVANSTSVPQKQKKKVRMSTKDAQLRTLQRAERQKEKELRKLQKEKELADRKEQKMRLKQQRQLEREQALKEKQLKKEREELERKERERIKLEKKELEEKERQRKLLEKEEKNKIKQQQLIAKAEEKRKKEEEKRKAEEEKKKMEMEKERLKAKTKEAFVSYFVRGDSFVSPPTNQMKVNEKTAFLPFQVTEDMVLAPIIPTIARERFNREKFEKVLEAQNTQNLYIKLLKSGQYKDVRQRKRILPKKRADEEVIIISNNAEQADLNSKAKLLQFHENIRPPYWGTWRKKSKNISPRNPFGRGDGLDYSVDSDDEWDEGGPGESLSGTEDEESEDDYEVDNEFFVPHGYLSSDEEDEDENSSPKDPEEQRMKLKIKEQAFLCEKNKKTLELKPVVLGCFFEADEDVDSCIFEKSLQPYSAVFLTTKPVLTVLTNSKMQVSSASQTADSVSPSRDGSQKCSKRPVPEEAMPYLIQLLHANTNGRDYVIKEFQEFWSSRCKKLNNELTDSDLKENATPDSNIKNNTQESLQNESIENKVPIDDQKISKRQLNITIQKISSYGKCPSGQIKKCWWVNPDILEKYGCVDSPVPNKWNYVTSRDSEMATPNTTPSVTTPSIKGFLNGSSAE